MNKVLKGLVAVVSAAAMAIAGFAGAASAMAADTYEVSVDQSDSHTYNAYQVFTGTLASNGATLSDLKWGANSKPSGSAKTGDSVDDATVKTLTDLAGKPYKEIQDEVNKYVDFSSTAAATGITKDAPKQLTAGYYVFKDMTAVKQQDDALSLHLTKVVGPTTLKAKKDVPEVEKKVKENVKATDETAYGPQYNDTADYNIGDMVPFHLIGSVPDMSNYDTYKYIFHDTLDAAFDAPAREDVKVYLSSDKIKDDADSITKKATVKVDTTNNNITVTFDDLKTVDGVVNAKYIIVEYSAKLNSNAVIGDAGNRNSVYLEYSNNPNQSGKGDTGRTPDDKVVAFTYELDTTKIDKNDLAKKLPNAKFKLYRASGKEKQYAQVTDGKLSGWIGEADKATELSSDAGGLFKVAGLDDGTYYLEETVAPDEYNKLTEPIAVVISANTTNSQNWTNYDKTPLTKIDVTANGTKGTGNEETGVASIMVANAKGSKLPSTGGMGTKILYAAGAAIVLVAAFGIVFAVRRRNAR